MDNFVSIIKKLFCYTPERLFYRDFLILYTMFLVVFYSLGYVYLYFLCRTFLMIFYAPVLYFIVKYGFFNIYYVFLLYILMSCIWFHVKNLFFFIDRDDEVK